jgi:hypothetical protein
MTRYKSKDNATIIKTNQILIRDAIVTAVKNRHGKDKLKGFKCDPDRKFETPLNRLDRVAQGMDEQVELPPVKVKLFREIRDVKYYRVIDGRHRFAMSIVNGYDELPVEIVEDST